MHEKKSKKNKSDFDVVDQNQAYFLFKRGRLSQTL
ncbi:hypothetical protein EHR_08845 [Enterococcus hirae ATCC 9790]|uniref:Uncharacterized protein n=1 Tax=Enterococcus hirae (strain ATCC 9790 / DSM 20160 / JCM 8729 / LMG 6399 / NBRC 3181 / NCIMB 6459 / NCDO 1258 / NCTC 12367 / WDCM 00089 / R) TaxID=768486 RepID=I6TBJ2_ENTHA|nr:hypothetical protein EHR_08845 [Enterococcus hirae ATCC 9790]